MYECIVYRDHSTCTCQCFKYSSICKHSLCVYEIEGILKEHLDYFSRLPRSSLLSKGNLVKPTKDAQGKKGGAHRNPWRPSRGGTAQKHPFTKIHHNNQPFVVGFLDDQRNAKECRYRRVEFPRRQQIVPFDIINFCPNKKSGCTLLSRIQKPNSPLQSSLQSTTV